MRLRFAPWLKASVRPYQISAFTGLGRDETAGAASGEGGRRKIVLTAIRRRL